MSLAPTNNAIVQGTLKNDLVLYHKNPINNVVIGIQGSSNCLVVSASNVVVNGSFVCAQPKYPYALFVGQGGGQGSFVPIAGALETARFGMTLTSNNAIHVPTPGVYFCTLAYNNLNGTIAVLADGASPSIADFGTTVTGTGLSGQCTMVLTVSSFVQVSTNFIANTDQTLAMRRIV